jgi:hypothetical protein
MLTLLLSTQLANADLIDFTSDPVGPKPNGFVSVDSALVSFSDSSGTDLVLADFGPSSNGNALATGLADPSSLVMTFGVLPATDLELSFGGDTAPGVAVLTALSGGVPVGFDAVPMNGDGIMNQTVALSGLVFDQAVFQYTADGVNPLPLVEIVDNINFNVVPVPGAILLGILGLSVAGVKLRRFA